MSDNVVFLESAKHGVILKAESKNDDTIEEIKRHNRENIDALSKAIDASEIRSLVSIALNYDGSINWMVSGLSSSFEIIAALESTKHDFMNAE